MNRRLGAITTPWTDILAAQVNPELRARCLKELAEKYYEPIRGFIYSRSRVASQQDLDDMTQEFFTHFLEKNLFDGLDRERGKLRSFLMKVADNFVKDQKRLGGRQNPNSPLTRHSRLQYEESVANDSAPSPEDVFNRDWARALLADILDVFKAACFDKNKPHYYSVAEQQLLYPEKFDNPTYEETAASLGMDEKKVASIRNRAQKILREVTWGIVRGTVVSDGEADREMADLEKYLRQQL